MCHSSLTVGCGLGVRQFYHMNLKLCVVWRACKSDPLSKNISPLAKKWFHRRTWIQAKTVLIDWVILINNREQYQCLRDSSWIEKFKGLSYSYSQIRSVSEFEWTSPSVWISIQFQCLSFKREQYWYFKQCSFFIEKDTRTIIVKHSPEHVSGSITKTLTKIFMSYPLFLEDKEVER